MREKNYKIENWKECMRKNKPWTSNISCHISSSSRQQIHIFFLDILTMDNIEKDSQRKIEMQVFLFPPKTFFDVQEDSF